MDYARTFKGIFKDDLGYMKNDLYDCWDIVHFNGYDFEDCDDSYFTPLVSGFKTAQECLDAINDYKNNQ